MAIVYLNGEYVDAAAARVSIFDRGLLLGDGVFETGRLYQGRYFRLEQHLRRLAGSAAILRLDAPPLEQLADIARQLAERNALTDGSLRITITRGTGGRGLRRHGAGPATVIATLAPIPADWKERAAAGWRILTSSVRRPAGNSVPAQLKGLGRTYALLAHYEAEDAGFDDALLLSADGWVAEGPTWNVFWRTGRTVFTPSLDTGILEGVTRDILMELARAAGYAVKEGRFTLDELQRAEEVFATMTSNGVVPFAALDGRSLTAREASDRLQVDYWTLVGRETGQTE